MSRTTDDYLITWLPEYSVNIQAIDKQHLVLVGLIRQLQEAMAEGRGRAFQHQLIDRLVEYTNHHFRFEEELMSKHGYELLAEHIEQHRALTNQVSELHQKIQSHEAISNASIMLFLRNWLTDHIMQHDQKYAQVCNPAG
jgi:hemerythrin-like metal-binding protein